jgi:hypothetical protein
MSVSSDAKYGDLKAADQSLEIPCSGYGSVGIQASGTWAGTLTFEGTVDRGSWQALNVALTNSSSQVTTATANGVWRGSVAGLLAVRVRMSAYTSGTASVRILIAGASSASAGGGGGAGSDVNLIEVGGASIALGQAAMAASLPVVIASDQTPIPITGSITADNASVSDTGAAVPAKATYVGILGPSGNLQGLAGETFDLDTGAGTALTSALAIALPASGGPVVGGTATNPIRVDPTGATTQPISAASLPLPTGASTAANQATANGLLVSMDGHLASIETTSGLAAASLALMDDWDESDRAKVNPIVGQAGVAAGAGAVGATVQRVVLATDTTVPNVTGNIAADSADSGNPVKVGAVAYSPDGTTPGTAVAEGDRSNAKTDLDGNLFVKVNPATSKTVHLDGSSAYTDQSLIADPGDGFQAVITNIIASTGAATALNFFLEEGSTKIFGPIYLEAVAGRGFCSGPIYLPCTASTAVTLTSSASIAQSFQVNYFVQAV